MEMNEVVNIIGSLGFPIFACCVMFKLNTDLQKTLTQIQITMQKMADEIADLDRREKEHVDAGN